MYQTQILGVQERNILDIISEKPLIIDSESNGQLEILIGDQVITLLLGRYTLQDSEDSIWAPTIIQFKQG